MIITFELIDQRNLNVMICVKFEKVFFPLTSCNVLVFFLFFSLCSVTSVDFFFVSSK